MRRILNRFRRPNLIHDPACNQPPCTRANRGLYRRSLRLEWLEDRSLLSVAPTGVDLLAISDSGILDNDNLTNLDNSTAANALQFEVFGTVAGATVTLYADGMAIGSATAAGDTTPVTTTGAFDLADGAHSITARLTETASPESPDSPALGVVIDTAGPSATTDHIAKLVAADGSPDDHFGSSGVSISGNRALVGAYGDDDRGLRSGSAYVFATAPSGWVQLTKLTASDGTSDDYFGFSVAIDGSIAVVGAHADNNFSGAAYVFEETGSGWVQVAKLTANDGAASDYFGYSVSVSGNLAIVGAHGDDDLGSNSGSAYVFEDAGSGWTQIQKLTAADASAGDNFGRSISIDGQRAVIGGASSAYVFQDTGSSWTQVAKLTASDALAGDGFGQSVSLDGATAIVGAYGDDDKGYASGSAYVFKDAGSGWTQIQKLTAADGSAGDYFGLSVSVSGSTIIVGSPDDDDGGSSAGSAYVFQNTGSSWTQIAKRTANDGAASDCFGCSVSTDGATVLVGASGVAALAGSAYLFAAAGPVIQDTGVSAADQITADATPAVAFAFREAIYGQDSDVTVLDPSASPITPDAITGWGTQILTITFSTPLVSDGQYTVQLSGTITDAADNAIGSGAGYTMTFTLDTTAPPSPTTVPRLLASSDSGISQHDKVTNDATPTLQGFGIPYFRVYCDGVLASGNYESVTATLPTQPDGVHAYTVTAVDAAGNESPPCGTLMLTIDTVAPDAPAPPDLQAASDTGVSDADNLTNPTTLTFDVVAAPYFRFYRGWTRLGGDYETGTTCTVSGQPEGAQSYTVCAVDAAGNESAASSSLSVVIDTTMPFQQSAQIAKLLAADGAAGDNFGCSVSISGNLAIVGADGDDDKGSGSGSAYVFKDAGSGWTQVAKLTASDGAQSDAFGMRVSISGNLALVGAFRDDDKGSNSGSAYVFKDTGSGWTQVAKLTAADGAADDCFGWSVALDGATAIVGAYADDDLGSNSGSAYVFKDAGSGWTQVAKLTASDGADYDYFGTSVSINGSAAVVGADGNSGSAYVFEDAASGWTQAAKLTADDGPGSNYFGYSVSISGNVAVIGACGSGSAYVFTDTGSAWTEAARLTAAEGADEDFFGQSVSVSGPTIAVGAYRDDDKGSDSGSVHVFLYTGSGWAQIARHTASDGAAGDYLGWSVSTNGATTIAGAYGDDDKGNSAGSAYLSSVPPWMDLRAASDTGASNTDNVTSDATPTFDVNVSGNYFRIYCDGVQVTGDYESGTTYAPPALPDGAYVYTIVIVDAAGNALFADPLTLTVDTQSPNAPAAPDLISASDSGVSSTDNLTNDYTPTFSATGAPYFRLYTDGVQTSGNYETASYTTPAQADGAHQYTATAVDAAGNESALSVSLTVTIDTVAPPVPAALDLQPASDSGASDSDNVTSDTTPTFDTDAAPFFRVYRGSVQLSGNYESGTTYTAPVQNDGAYAFNVRAVDAAGNLSASSPTLTVTVDTVGPIAIGQVAKLAAADGMRFDSFGQSVAIDGSVAIVGVPGDDVPYSDCYGSAYIFEHTGAGWSQIAQLVPTDGTAFFAFGTSVAISGTTAIIGAYGSSGFAGSAYIFENAGSGWTQVAKLAPSGGSSGNYFGSSVSISGDRAIVGAYQDSSGGTYSGAAYVFADNGVAWSQVAKLVASDAAKGDYFGAAVSISGSVAIVGAYGDGDKGPRSGSAYVFTDTGSSWSQVAKLTASDGAAYNYFGRSVAIDGQRAVVGASGNMDSTSYPGAAYVFENAGSGWTQSAQLVAADRAANDAFGCSVSIDENRIVVGALRDSDNGIISGSAYIFENTGSGWAQRAKLLAGDRAPGDYFGCSVSISGSDVFVGASNATGVGSYTGAAYVFSTGPQLSDDTGATADDHITSDSTPSLAFVFSEPVFGQPGDVTVLDPNGDPVAPDAITGWGTNSLVIGFTTPLTVEGEYTVTLAAADGVTDAAGNPINGGMDVTATFTLDTVAPTVEQVLVKGSDWDQAFLEGLDAQGLGHPTAARLGYRIPAGGGQLDALDWSNIDAVTVAFSEDVMVGQGSLAIRGMNVSGYSITGFHYDDETHCATWTLAQPIDADRVLIALHPALEDAAGNTLDGEWQNGDGAFPSGDGATGGDFRFLLNVLPGDANHDGTITALDASILAANWSSSGTGRTPGDVNGNGAVDAADAAVLAAHWASRLPAWLPGDADYSGTVDENDAMILATNWGERYSMSPGDADRSGVVDQNDAAILAAHWGMASGARWSDGDFNDDGQVNAVDASILAANWGRTSDRVTWREGDFNDDHVVNSLDASILAANWAATLVPSEESAPETPIPSDPTPLSNNPLIGPVQARPSGMIRPLLRPVRTESSITLPTSPFTLPTSHDAALADEDYGPSAQETLLDRERLAWSCVMAERQTSRRDRTLDKVALAVDLLMADD